MEERLQHQPTALEPQRAHTNRVRSTPQGGAKLEQTLLMIEGKLGSRSPDRLTPAQPRLCDRKSLRYIEHRHPSHAYTAADRQSAISLSVRRKLAQDNLTRHLAIEEPMSNRYASYTRLKIDYPSARILRLTFNRPETHNSVDAETHTQLTGIWREIDADPDISAVLVTGAGKAFSAGGDFELIKTILNDPVARMSTWKEAKDL